MGGRLISTFSTYLLGCVLTLLFSGLAAPTLAQAGAACPVTQGAGVSGSTGGFQAHGETKYASCPKPSPTVGDASSARPPEYFVYPECFTQASSNQNAVDCTSDRCAEGETAVVRYPNEGGRPNFNKPQRVCLSAAEAPPTITPAMILAEVRKIPLPKPALSVQPPGGRTLVNFPTIFSTTAAPITRTLTLAGVQVDVRIAPASYVWTFGDGAAPLRTSIPGRPWAKGVTDKEINRGLAAGFVTHEYVDAHVSVQTHVEVVYSASFSVAGGPWQEVGETVTAVGPAQALRIAEARPVLVG